jgi:hypothetical protein
LLTQFARRYPQHVDVLRKMTAYEGTTSGYVTLVPDRQNLSRHRGASSHLQSVAKEFSGIQIKAGSKLPDPEKQPVLLLDLLPNLIVTQFRSNEQKTDSKNAREDELLMLAVGVKTERVAEIYRTLHDFARPTFVRMAFTRSTGSPSQEYSLFYIKDSDDRGSGFDSAWISDLFPDCIRLKAYSVMDDDREYVFFLPDTLSPVNEVAVLLAQFLLAAPRLFTVEKPQPDPTAVFAIHTKSEDKWELLYLADLDFKTDVVIRPPVAGVEYVGLADSAERLKGLRALLDDDDQARDSGYRLHLRPSHYVNPQDNEREILLQQVAEIALQLIELDVQTFPQPRLYRFSQSQLPALADMLRVYLPDNLPAARNFLADSVQNPLLADMLRDTEHSPRIRYLFHANTDRDQAGVHYLLVDADIIMNNMDPMAWWRPGIGERPMHFWVDPLWAFYYRETQQKSLVFVPHGTRMHPIFHSWGVDSMHKYLQDVFRTQVDDLPEHPIYVFDGELGEGEDLYVEVLDLDKFAPITSPDVLSGLNKNLVILHHMPDTARLIEKMATACARQRLEGEVTETAATVHAKFEKQTKEVAKQFETDTASLLMFLAKSYDDLVKESKTFGEKAKKLNDEIRHLYNLHGLMRDGTIPTTRQTLSDTAAQRDQMELEIERKKGTVEQSIQRSDALQEKLRDAAEDAVAALLSTREHLDDLIRRLQSYGRR